MTFTRSLLMDESSHCYWKMTLGISHTETRKSLVSHYDGYTSGKNSLESKERNSMSQDISVTVQTTYFQTVNLFISLNYRVVY